MSGDSQHILHNGNDHWVCPASTKGVVYLADNLRVATTESLKKQMKEIYHSFKNDNNTTLELDLIKESL